MVTTAVVLVVLMLLVQSETCNAATYTVRDRRGWMFRMARWSKAKHFRTCDVIVFNYDSEFHNVVAVTSEGTRDASSREVPGCSNPERTELGCTRGITTSSTASPITVKRA